MTIKEFVINQNPKGINEWIDLIKKNNLENYESKIIECADYYNLIIINHNATFENSIK